VVHLLSRTVKEVIKSLRIIIGAYAARKITVTHLLSDGEGAIASMKPTSVCAYSPIDRSRGQSSALPWDSTPVGQFEARVLNFLFRFGGFFLPLRRKNT
jgi:hypothetical protein